MYWVFIISIFLLFKYYVPIQCCRYHIKIYYFLFRDFIMTKVPSYDAQIKIENQKSLICSVKFNQQNSIPLKQ